MRYDDFKLQIAKSNVNDWLANDELGKFTFKEDMRITILKEEEYPFGDDSFVESWATNFPDVQARTQRFFLQFNGSTIEEFYTAAIDGSRSFIPYPRLNDMTISEEQYIVGSVVNSIGGHKFDEYLKQIGITVRH